MKTKQKHKKIIIFYPPFEGKNILKSRPPFPLGPLYLAAYLEDKGIEARVKDFSYPLDRSKTVIPKQLKTKRKMFIRYGWTNEKIKKWLDENLSSFNCIVGVSSLMGSNYTGGYELIKLIRECSQSAIIVYGGAHVTTNPQHAMKYSGADYLCLGEGEEEFYKFVIGKKSNIINVHESRLFPYEKLIQYKSFVEDVNALPFPERKLLLDDRETVEIYVTFSRGCPHVCSYCVSHLIQSRKWRGKHLDTIIKEILFYKNKWKAKRFVIEDDNICPQKEGILFFKKLCRKIIKYVPKTRFKISHGIPVYASADKKMCDLFWRAGFREMVFPIESTNQAVLKEMKKGNVVPKWKTGLRNWTYEKNPPACIIIGYPFVDTIQSMIKTIVDISYEKARVWSSWFRLYPGTKLFNRCLEAGYVDKNYDIINSQSFFIETENFTIKDLQEVSQIARAVNYGVSYDVDIFNSVLDNKHFNSFKPVLNFEDTIAKGRFGFSKGQLIVAGIYLSLNSKITGKPMLSLNEEKNKIIYKGSKKSKVYDILYSVVTGKEKLKSERIKRYLK